MPQSSYSRRRFVSTGSRAGLLALSLPTWLASCSSNEADRQAAMEQDAGEGNEAETARTFDSPYTRELGLQLYTLRDALAEDPQATLQAVANAGYAHVELMDTSQIATLKPICDDLGLAVHSSFYNWTTVTGNQALLGEAAPTFSFEELVDDAAEAGLSHLIFGYMLPQERSTLDDYRRRAEDINRAAERIQAACMQRAYHHHSFEFKPLEAQGTSGWDILVKELDPAGTPFEIDVFWAALGDHDPVELIEQMKDRTRLVHLKDLRAATKLPHYDEATAPHEAFEEVGDGSLDFAAILEVAQAAGVKHAMVEQDWSPAPLKSIDQSARYLKA